MLVLEPKKINERMLKLHQKNKQFLMENEVLYFKYLDIDESWNFDLDVKYIKCKKIVGDIELYLNHIPSWMRYIEIDGSFNCSFCELNSLENCPKIINVNFNCGYNYINSLVDGPTYVGKYYWCWGNNIKFTKEYIRSICNFKNK